MEIATEAPELLFQFVESSVVVDEHEPLYAVVGVDDYGEFGFGEVVAIALLHVLW